MKRFHLLRWFRAILTLKYCMIYLTPASLEAQPPARGAYAPEGANREKLLNSFIPLRTLRAQCLCVR